jgi:hypothetical protein
MASRSLDDLHPRTRAKVVNALQGCKTDPWLAKENIDVLVTCTHRGAREQAELYAIGRTREQLDAAGLNTVLPRPGKIVTRALPGKSDHNFVDSFGKPAAQGVDIVPLRAGKPVWGMDGDGVDDNPADDLDDELEVWERIAAYFEQAGMKWYGRQDAPFREGCHFADKG